MPVSDQDACSKQTSTVHFLHKYESSIAGDPPVHNGVNTGAFRNTLVPPPAADPRSGIELTERSKTVKRLGRSVEAKAASKR